MTSRLRILAGPDTSSLKPITHLVNTGKAFEIKSDTFEGKILVYIQGLTSEVGDGDTGNAYFHSPNRTGVTWSIQAQGRFLQPHPADDILFGNTFDHPLNLPWGSGPALKLMKYVDPTLEQDLGSPSKPWALSPLISTMPYLSASRGATVPPFPGEVPIKEDMSHLADGTGDPTAYETADKRRAYFRDVEKRKEIVLGPELTLTMDFCYGYLSFHPSLALQLPGGVNLDLTRHWDGQQVRFVCCERRKGTVTGDKDPWGKIFWCVAIEPAASNKESEDQAYEQMNTVSDDID